MDEENDFHLSSNELAQKRTVLAAKRTVMAADRSLMSWIRTGLSLISFGFGFYQFLESLREKNVPLMMGPDGPRRIGLFLIGLGTVSLLLGSIQYWRVLKEVQSEFHYKAWKFPLLVASLVLCLGVVLFVVVMAKINLL